MIRRILLVLAILGAAVFASRGSVAEAGGCHHHGGYGYYRGGGYPGYHRTARYYGPRPGYYPRSAYYAGPPRYYGGGSGFYLSIGL